MKHITYFNDFMSETVNLNQTRIDDLERSVSAISTFLCEAEWDPSINRFIRQGSWAHKTIIKPIADRPFDADIIVAIDEVDGWQPSEYILSLRRIFSRSSRYTDKIKRHSHCITIEYAGERRIDVVPCIINRGGLTRLEVCNATSNEFEQTNPEAYTEWLIQRNNITKLNNFRKVTRLLKYLRDIKTTFTCPSILLTTILGLQVKDYDRYDLNDFVDLPTSLQTIIGRLDAWLQANPSRPVVFNPKLLSERFDTLWTDEQYSNFRDVLHRYRNWIEDAYAEDDSDESIGKWRRVFGDDFAAAAVTNSAKSISEVAITKAVSSFAYPVKIGVDLVALFLDIGRRALPSNFYRLPHMRRPTWIEVSPALLVLMYMPLYMPKKVAVLYRRCNPDRAL